MLSLTHNKPPSLRLALTALLAAHCLHAGPAPDPRLADLSLEELTHVAITSVARRDQSLMKAAAAVYVITSEDIARSGAASLPDALRLAPGVEVAQITADTWAVSIRGFNSRSANKILVLVDGRSIYNNLYSGTWWDQNQIPLEDIERIEIVRGPGATMWGANAVDGVISIVTKTADETRGLVVSTQAGQSQLPDSYVRYGGNAGARVQYRLDAHFAEMLPQRNAAGNPAGDRVSSGQSGARLDWKMSERDTLTADAQFYQGAGYQPVNPAFLLSTPLLAIQPFNFHGGFLRGQWKRRLSETSDLALQISETREVRNEALADSRLDTLDLDFQHHLLFGSRNDFNWGGGFRFHNDHVSGLLNPARIRETLTSLFVQDEFALLPGRLTLTGGLKAEEFRYRTGGRLEFEPQVRLLWTPRSHTSLWASASRAVRMPSELDRFLWLDNPLPSSGGIPGTEEVRGNPAIAGEIMLAFEAGVRRQWGKHFNLDVAAFSNHYTRLTEPVIGPPYVVFQPAPLIVLPASWSGTGSAESRGIEVAAAWSPASRWRLQFSYAFVEPSFPESVVTSPVPPPGTDWGTPDHVSGVRSSWDITNRWSFDSSLYSASGIVASEGGPVPAYARVDLRIARKLGEAGEFSAGVRNLFDTKRLEFLSQDNLVASYVGRNVFVKLVWRF